VNDVIFDHRVREQGAGNPIELGGVGLAIDVDLEALSLSDAGDATHPQSGKRTLDGLTLGVEDLRFEHDVDDDASHGLLRLLGGGIQPHPTRDSRGPHCGG